MVQDSLPGEVIRHDRDRNKVEGAISYLGGLVRMVRSTLEGFLVGGHARFRIALFSENLNLDPRIAREVDIRERNATLITWENKQNGDITIDIAGLNESAGAEFPLPFSVVGAPLTLVLAPGATHFETLGDNWGFLSLGVDPAAAGQAGTVEVIVQERTG